MRKLLIVSQKSGVGKTTAAINLAAATAQAGAKVLLLEADSISTVSEYLKLSEHPQRQSLRDLGIELPGVLCCDVLPGLDVISPYDEGGCSDENLDQMLGMLADRALQDGYDCLLVNAPPFLGGRPAPLLAACPDFLVVLQAEPMAYRTMPAFLQMIQKAGDEHSIPVHMDGALITLPSTEAPGGRWERELRGRLGKRAIPAVVPYDEEIPKARMFGHVSVDASAAAPSTAVYQEVAATLKLAEKANRDVSRSAKSALMLAATSARINEAAAQPVAASTATQAPPAPRRFTPTVRKQPHLPSRRAPERRRATGPETRHNPGGRAGQTTTHAPTPTGSPTRLRWLWPVWIVLGAILGVGLRFVSLPPAAIPVIVGLGVSAAVALGIRLCSMQQQAANQVAPVPVGGPSRSRRRHAPHRY